jgi:hypothetical protein
MRKRGRRFRLSAAGTTWHALFARTVDRGIFCFFILGGAETMPLRIEEVEAPLDDFRALSSSADVFKIFTLLETIAAIVAGRESPGNPGRGARI